MWLYFSFTKLSIIRSMLYLLHFVWFKSLAKISSFYCEILIEQNSVNFDITKKKGLCGWVKNWWNINCFAKFQLKIFKYFSRLIQNICICIYHLSLPFDVDVLWNTWKCTFEVISFFSKGNQNKRRKLCRQIIHNTKKTCWFC